MLTHANRPAEAAIALEYAIALYEQEGNNVPAQQTRAALTALQSILAHGPKLTT